MIDRTNTLLLAGLLTFSFGGTVHAEATPEEIARLGNDLTPLGAIRAGNEAGTIPEWTGGITEAPPGYTPGDHHPDPYADDEILYTVTAENMDQYADVLTEGQKAMLRTYPDTYRMHVYPTRRSASLPQRVYDATRNIAADARLTDNGNGVANAAQGTPFPIPDNGLEAIWNHLLHWRGDGVRRDTLQAAPTRNGDYTLVKYRDEVSFVYDQADATPENINNKIAYFKQRIVSPARLAGKIFLVIETLDQAKEPRSAWVYNPGQRRVRRAPNVAFDTPRDGADGLSTSDQFDMYNGSPERYNWELVGRREMLVPYNSYKLHSDQVKYSDILTPNHINQDLARYELHRVWVVEATLKDGARHIYKRRTFYLDEDSWQAVHIDHYDARDQIWRVAEGHGINYYDIKSYWTTLEVSSDLQAGRYFALGLDNEDEMYDFNVDLSLTNYTVSALRREGRR